MDEILRKRIEDFASEYAERMYKNSTDGERRVAMTVQEVIDALEKVRDKSKLVTTGETGGTIIQVIDTSTYVFLNKAIYGRINDTRED